MNVLHCDECNREAPESFEEARDSGWYLSSKLSVSGIPWDMLCPDCRHSHIEPKIIH